jgi:small-conductance mechanosensitive channel
MRDARAEHRLRRSADRTRERVRPHPQAAGEDVRQTKHALRHLVALALGAATLIPARVAAQSVPPADSLSPAAATSTVSFHGHPLFALSAGLRNVTARQRAQVVSERLEHLVRNAEFVPESLSVVDTEISADVQAGDFLALAVTDLDTIGTGLGRHELAEQRAGILRAALIGYRQERSARRLGWAAVKTTLATLALIVALMLLARLRRRGSAVLGGWIEARREQIRTRTHSILEPDRLLVALASLLNVLGGLLSLVLMYVYTSFVLACWPWTQAAGAQLGALILRPLSQLGSGFVSNLPGFVFIAVVAVVTRYVLKLVGFLFAEVAAGRIGLHGFYPEWALPTQRIVRVVILSLAVVVVYPFVPGSDSLAFKGISLFLGVLVSLGSTSVVGNLMAGIMVVYMRSYSVGDIIKVGEDFGRVIETDLLATRLRTPKNVEITIPNSTMISSNIINFSRQAAQDGLILHTEVTIGYNAPWRQVHAMLLRAAARTPGLLQEPAPFVLQRELGNFAVAYEINGYTHEPQRMNRIYSALHKNILDEFNEYGVEILTPSYEGDRDEPAVVAKEHWYDAPAIPKGQPGADE